MFYFYARFSDEEIRDIVQNILRTKSEKDFLKLMRYFSTFFLGVIKRMINRTMYAGRYTKDDIEELVNIANSWLWDYIIKKGYGKWDPETVDFARFESVFKNIINKNFIGEIHKVFGTPSVKISRPTFQKVKNVARFMNEYYQKHKRQPETKLIAKELGLSEKLVNKYIRAGNLYNKKSLDDFVKNDDGESRLENFIEGPSQYLPDNQYLEKEEKRLVHDAIARSKEKTRAWINQLVQKSIKSKNRKPGDEDRIKLLENFDNILAKLINEQGKKQRQIELDYNFNSVKILQRLWGYFIDNIKNDKKVKQWVEASSRNRMIKKYSKLIVNNYFSKTGEQIISSILKKI